MLTHAYLDQLRIRWMTRATDRANAPAPVRTLAMSWPDTLTGGTMGDFYYVDTIVDDPSTAPFGPVLSRDNMLVDPRFTNKPLWVMARLEVDEATKYGRQDPRTVQPFYVSSARSGGVTIITVHRGDEDAWCVGQMILQPSPAWLITYEVAGVLLTAAPDSFMWNVPDEEIELTVSGLVPGGFMLHGVRLESLGVPLWTRAWHVGQQLPDGPYGQLVLTNRNASLTVSPILDCP